jgi:hypothetical protein
MASQLVFLRFPTGESESRITPDSPVIGETFRRGDAEWRASAVDWDENERAVVTLVAVDGSTTILGASGAGIPCQSDV